MFLRLLEPSWAHAGNGAAAGGARPWEASEEESRTEGQYTHLKSLQNLDLTGEDDIIEGDLLSSMARALVWGSV